MLLQFLKFRKFLQGWIGSISFILWKDEMFLPELKKKKSKPICSKWPKNDFIVAVYHTYWNVFQKIISRDHMLGNAFSSRNKAEGKEGENDKNCQSLRFRCAGGV